MLPVLGLGETETDCGLVIEVPRVSKSDDKSSLSSI
jgi:hypothetical protein